MPDGNRSTARPRHTAARHRPRCRRRQSHRHRQSLRNEPRPVGCARGSTYENALLRELWQQELLARVHGGRKLIRWLQAQPARTAAMSAPKKDPLDIVDIAFGPKAFTNYSTPEAPVAPPLPP